jgi:hypothetical protein
LVDVVPSSVHRWQHNARRENGGKLAFSRVSLKFDEFQLVYI